jgi:NAD+ kinase
MTTVGVIYKKENRLIAGTAEQLIKDLRKNKYKVSLTNPKFVITLGGDGTILRAARMLAKKGIPILGVHMGGVGFMSEIELREINEALARIKKGKFKIDERIMLEAMVGGKKIIALNDLVISKSGIARVIKIELEGIAEYTADGIIFSTATGSTAYNLSAGGPLLTPHSQSMIISAICPHSISTRPIVVEKAVTAVLNRGAEVIMTADGQQVIPLEEGHKIRVQKSKLKTRFIRLKDYKFFEKAKDVFGFGPQA